METTSNVAPPGQSAARLRKAIFFSAAFTAVAGIVMPMTPVLGAGDSTPPTVSLTAPAAGTAVSGTVSVRATASDNVGVVAVQFNIDGVALGAEDTVWPYSLSWNTASASSGAHTLTAVARDAAGNMATSAGRTVTVSNGTVGAGAAPAISGTASGSIADTSAAVGWMTNTVADTQVTYGPTTAYGYSTPLVTTLTYVHDVVLAGLSSGTTYHFCVRSRDGAGNLATSADYTFTTLGSATAQAQVFAPPIAPLAPQTGAGILFDSAWDTATGTTTDAVTDAGRWPLYDEFNRGTGVKLLSVVPGGPNGHNALRVQQRGSTYAANLQKPAFAAPATDFYVRYYMKNDDTSAAGDHIVTADIYQYENLTYMRKNSSPTDWSFVIGAYGCGYTYPIGYWRPTLPLAHGVWYRLEYYVHYTNASHVQVHPRVYDASGALIFSDAQFMQSDPGSATWNGRSDWTLASFYAGGNDFCVNASFMNTFGVGNNGQQFATDTGQYWYFAGVQIRTDTWPGPIAAAGFGLDAMLSDHAPAALAPAEPPQAWRAGASGRTRRRMRVRRQSTVSDARQDESS